MEEIWKDIVGYEGFYQVSNLGRVKSLYRTFIRKNSSPFVVKSRILKAVLDTKGYPRVALCVCKSKKYCAVHRLVAEAFIPNPFNKPDVDHIDTNRANAIVSNLRWVTSSENHLNPITRAKFVQNNPSKGKRYGDSFCAKPLKAISVSTGEVVFYDSMKRAKEYGYNPEAIKKRLNGHSRPYKGFWWKRA